MLDDNDNVLKFRTIWISDMHLGTPGSRATDLLHFLKYTRSETLYLVGDVIDGWQLKKRFYWSLSQFLKHGVKSAVSFISAFETAMLTETSGRRCDGVFCGLIHKPEMREVNGLL